MTKNPLSEHIKHLLTIPAGENKELYDIEGNLDIEVSASKSNSSSKPEVILVETIEVDEFEDQDTDISSVLSDLNDTMMQSNDIVDTSDTIFAFTLVEQAPGNVGVLIDPFVLECFICRYTNYQR